MKNVRQLLKMAGMTPKELRLKAAHTMLEDWSAIVLAINGSVCAWCGSTNRLQGHHIFARVDCDRLGWFDYDNGMPLCYRCHFHRLKADPDGYIIARDKFLAAKGLTYDDLKIRWGNRKRANDRELLLVGIRLKRDLSTPSSGKVNKRVRRQKDPASGPRRPGETAEACVMRLANERARSGRQLHHRKKRGKEDRGDWKVYDNSDGKALSRVMDDIGMTPKKRKKT